ncbi:hypothetical protein ACNFIA_24415 [Pseudomonas sp. NY15437]|uniref:hypothetical protein n=1 Tax=Pseudomonas sp. NY15437 TaxID=3400360 RepID=UPI003A8954A6
MEKSFVLLMQEAYLMRSCLSTGLTALRKAHVHNRGEFYIALFNLSIGLERLMKAIVIIDHMQKNGGSVPTRKILKDKYRHGLILLYDACAAIGEPLGIKINESSSLDKIDNSIINLLNEFAQTARYHNLDELHSPSQNTDPLEQLENILYDILKSDVRPATVSKIMARAKFVSDKIKDITHVNMLDLKQQQLSLLETISQPALHEQAIRYAVLRIVNILYPLKKLLGKISFDYHYSGKAASKVPLMGEFLEWIWDDRSSVLRKKRWP